MPLTPTGFDVVQVLKQEWSDLGGGEGSDYPSPNVPLSPFQDAPEVPCIFIVESGRRNKNVAVWAYQGKMRFRDVENPGSSGEGYTLTELLAGAGGLTEEGHKVLRQLIHWIPDGPGDGFSTTPFKKTTWSGIFKTAEVWWESSSMLKKIFEHTMTWTGINKTGEVWTLYKTDGTSPHARATDTITFNGIFEDERTRVYTVWP